MFRNLSPWGKRAWHAMIDKNYEIKDIAEATGYRREYVSSLLHGKQNSAAARKRISDFLDIDDEL